MLERLGHGFAALPSALVLGLWLATAALLLLLHLRRQHQRRQILVSAESLWAHLPDSETAPPLEAGARRWRALPRAFWWQLLVGTALILAAGDPRPLLRPGQRLAILVDTSASMGASSASVTRLTEARQRAAALVEGLGPGDEALLVEFARRPMPLAGWTADRRQLIAALDALAVRPETGELPAALRFARETLGRHPQGRAVVITDQRSAAMAAAGVEGLQTVVVGRPGANVALQALTAERAPQDPDSVLAQALVTNFGERAATVRVSLRRAGEPRGPALFAGERSNLAPGTSAIVALPFRSPGRLEIEATLDGPNAGADNELGLDDRARALVLPARRRRVLVAGARNLYLEGALLSFGRELAVEQLAGPDAERRRADWPDYDLVIFDGWTPEPAPDHGRYLYLAPAGPGSPFSQRGAIDNPTPTEIAREHPLVRQLALADLNIKRAVRLVAEAGDEVPLATAGAPLMIARARGRLRQVALAFDPRRSDLPLRPAFPLWLANVLDWVGGETGYTSSRPLAAPALDARELDTRASGRIGASNVVPPAPAARAGRSWLTPALLGLALLGCLRLWGRPLGAWLRRRAGPAVISYRVLHLLRLLAMAAICVALLGPRVERPSRAQQVAVLLDVSASVDPGALASAHAEVEAFAVRAASDGRDVVVRRFRFARQTVGLSDGDPDRNATDLGTALHTGLAALGRERLGRLLVLSDGRDTGGDVPAAVARATGAAVPIFARALPARAAEPIALEALRVAGGARQGAAFDLEAELRVRAPGDVRLRLEQLLPPAAERALTRTLAPGRNLVTFPARVDEEVAVFRLHAAPEPAPAGTVPAMSIIAVAAESRPRVLVLESTPDACLPLRRALAAEKMVVELGRERVPPAEQLADTDLVVLCDVALRALPASGQRDLLAFVRERGGGLLVTGGLEGWGAGAYQGTALDALLPLSHLPPARKEEATTALALVIDRSGSMSGPKIELAKEAARASAAMMNPLDLIAVIAFDSQASTVVRLQPASNRQRILGDIGSLRSGGGTNILAGLREAVAELQSAQARRKHIILLSDGQSPTEGLTELVEEAVAGHITLSAVGVGDGADLPLLQLIAGRGGGRFHRTRDPGSLPRIFSRETAEVTSSAEDPRGTRVRLARPAEALSGVPLAQAPPLFGHARGRERPGAEVLLRSERGLPLLVRWQQGLGQVMIWTGDFSSRWSGEWLGWRFFGKLWGQLGRSAMLRRGAESLPLEASRLGAEVQVRVRAFDSEDRPRRGLVGTLAIREIRADGSLQPRSGPEPALLEGIPGEYQARAPAAEAAALLLEGHLRHPERPGPGWRARGQLALLPALEGRDEGGRPPGSGTALLAGLAQETGGRVLGRDLGPVLDVGANRARRSVALRPWLALGALVLFLAAIALRRANFRAPD